MPLPVSTVAAWILTSRTPVVSSGDVKVKVASHLSNLPAIFTEDLTWKLIQLSIGESSKIGACARLSDGKMIGAKKILNCAAHRAGPISFISKLRLDTCMEVAQSALHWPCKLPLVRISLNCRPMNC